MAKVMLNLASTGYGDPISGGIIEDKAYIPKARTPIESGLDIRDRLAELVGKGNALSPDDKAAIYGGLVNILGKDKATKIMDHAYIFNSRPEVQKLPLEDKLRSFYEIGSKDAAVQDIMGKTRSLGYGVVPGFRESASSINQELLGRNQSVATNVADGDIRKKVMLKIKK